MKKDGMFFDKRAASVRGMFFGELAGRATGLFNKTAGPESADPNEAGPDGAAIAASSPADPGEEIGGGMYGTGAGKPSKMTQQRKREHSKLAELLATAGAGEHRSAVKVAADLLETDLDDKPAEKKPAAPVAGDGLPRVPGQPKGLSRSGNENWNEQANNYIGSGGDKKSFPGPPKGAKPEDPYKGSSKSDAEPSRLRNMFVPSLAQKGGVERATGGAGSVGAAGPAKPNPYENKAAKKPAPAAKKPAGNQWRGPIASGAIAASAQKAKPTSALERGGFNASNQSKPAGAANMPPAKAFASGMDAFRQGIGKGVGNVTAARAQGAAGASAAVGGAAKGAGTQKFATLRELLKSSSAAPSDWEAEVGIPTGFHRPTREQPEPLEEGGERFHSSLAKSPSTGVEPSMRHGVREGGSMNLPATSGSQLGKHAAAIPQFLGTSFAKQAVDSDEAKGYLSERLSEMGDSLKGSGRDLAGTADNALKSVTRSPIGAGLLALGVGKLGLSTLKGAGRGVARLARGGSKVHVPEPGLIGRAVGGLRKLVSGHRGHH